MIELAKNLDENEIFKNKAKSLSLIKDNIFYTRVNKESIDNINYGEFDKSNDLDIELVKQLTNIRAF